MGLVDKVTDADGWRDAARKLIAARPPKKQAPFAERVLNLAPVRPFIRNVLIKQVRRKAVITVLNKARAMELQAIHQYMNQHYGLDDMDYGELAGKMKLIGYFPTAHFPKPLTTLTRHNPDLLPICKH